LVHAGADVAHPLSLPVEDFFKPRIDRVLARLMRISILKLIVASVRISVLLHALLVRILLIKVSLDFVNLTFKSRIVLFFRFHFHLLLHWLALAKGFLLRFILAGVLAVPVHFLILVDWSHLHSARLFRLSSQL